MLYHGPQVHLRQSGISQFLENIKSPSLCNSLKGDVLMGVEKPTQSMLVPTKKECLGPSFDVKGQKAKFMKSKG